MDRGEETKPISSAQVKMIPLIRGCVVFALNVIMNPFGSTHGMGMISQGDKYITDLPILRGMPLPGFPLPIEQQGSNSSKNDGIPEF
jgi:hypothetical protein